MLSERLVLMHDLLSQDGTVWVHLDDYAGHYVKIVLDEVFGRNKKVNQIIWHYPDNFQGNLNRYADNHNFILVYGKSTQVRLERVKIPLDKPVKRDKRVWNKQLQRIVAARDADGNIIYEEYTDRYADNVWRIGQSSVSKRRSAEYLGYPTQKPKELLRRVVLSASKPDSLIADFFCGSGTTLAVAEKLGRRWIGCDLGRYAVHTTRKRLMGIPDCRPFEILNLGQYERQVWQGVTFGGQKQTQQMLIFEYLKFILELYGAQPLAGTQHLHGKKGSAVVHVGAVDTPITIDEINACLAECKAMAQKELHVLGWEWEMGLANLMVDQAKAQGIKLLLMTIPRQVMEQQAVEKGDIRFYELAYLEVEISPSRKKRSYRVELTDFAIPNDELIPPEVRAKIRKWSDYVDYWAVDWDFRNDTFVNGWTSYRTRRERTLQLKTDPHVYEQPGTYRVLVKVIDIFGNDTSQMFKVEVE